MSQSTNLLANNVTNNDDHLLEWKSNFENINFSSVKVDDSKNQTQKPRINLEPGDTINFNIDINMKNADDLVNLPTGLLQSTIDKVVDYAFNNESQITEPIKFTVPDSFVSVILTPTVKKVSRKKNISLESIKRETEKGLMGKSIEKKPHIGLTEKPIERTLQSRILNVLSPSQKKKITKKQTTKEYGFSVSHSFHDRKLKKSSESKDSTGSNLLLKLSRSLNTSTNNTLLRKLSRSLDYSNNKAEDGNDQIESFFRRTSSRLVNLTEIRFVIGQIYHKQFLASKAKSIRYRENVFKAAVKLTTEMAPFPEWTYIDEDFDEMDLATVNVGGHVFKIRHDTLLKMSNTKLTQCWANSSHNNQIFIDRDSNCFRAIHHFYCTGQLHTPMNICLIYFQQELEFWGISEDFLEPCCWPKYNSYRNAANQLSMYSEDNEKSRRHYMTHDKNMSQITWFRNTLYKVLCGTDNGIGTKWVTFINACFILGSIMCLMITTILIELRQSSYDSEQPKLTKENQKIIFYIMVIEKIITGFFLTDVLLRYILTREKLPFFGDLFNWLDIIVVTANFTTLINAKYDSLGIHLFILKIPRILRLLKITLRIRSGIHAFCLTIKASARELNVIFMFLFMFTVVFGALFFITEINDIPNVYIGSWVAFATITHVGYGDYKPITPWGKLLATICLMSGMIICQMPIPVFLTNFSIYYNQASSRLVSQTQLLLHSKIQKNLADQTYLDEKQLEKKKNIGVDKLNKIFRKD